MLLFRWKNVTLRASPTLIRRKQVEGPKDAVRAIDVSENGSVSISVGVCVLIL